MTTFQKLNPSYACLFIDHKRKKVHFHYPQKNSCYEMLLIGFCQMWWRIAAIFLIVNGLFLMVYGVVYLATLPPVDPTVISTGSGDATWIVILLSAAVVFFIVPPFVISYIFMKNEKLLKIYPEIYTRFCKFMDNYKYVKVTKLKSKVYEIPVFDNTFMDYAVTGEFKKYLKNVEIKNYPFKEATKHWRTGKIEKVECIEFWKSIFTFSQIPTTGYLEVNYH